MALWHLAMGHHQDRLEEGDQGTPGLQVALWGHSAHPIPVGIGGAAHGTPHRHPGVLRAPSAPGI